MYIWHHVRLTPCKETGLLWLVRLPATSDDCRRAPMALGMVLEELLRLRVFLPVRMQQRAQQPIGWAMCGRDIKQLLTG